MVVLYVRGSERIVMNEHYVRVVLLIPCKIEFEINFEISYHLVIADSEGDKPSTNSCLFQIISVYL